MNNPQIYNFLSQYDKSEWDAIIEDLILYSINKIKEIEKAEMSQKKKENQIKPIYRGSGIISFNNCNCNPFECATNFLKENEKIKSNTGLKQKTLNKLDELNKKINNIHSGYKTKSSKKISKK